MISDTVSRSGAELNDAAAAGNGPLTLVKVAELYDREAIPAGELTEARALR